MRISDWSSDVCSSDLCQGRCACGCPDRGDHGGKEDGRSYPALPSAAPVRGHRRSASDGGRRTRECERTDHSYDGRGNGSNDSRPDKRRIGKECVSPCRYWGSPYHQKKKLHKKIKKTQT